jgi:S1-C subfamily serine protease
MNWGKSVVQLIVKSTEIDYSHPLNVHGTITKTGTGFFITNNIILTCYHVVKYAVNIEIMYEQTNNITGTILHIFPHDDIAIIQLDKNIDDAIILEHTIIRNNEQNTREVVAVGFPLGSKNIVVTTGSISSYHESLFQVDATLNPGNSGGPLMIKENNKYKVIGVNVSKIIEGGERTGFVVPIYRCKIMENKLNSIILKKPIIYLDYQELIQDKFREEYFGENNNTFFKNMNGIRITMLNSNYYISKYLKIDDVILSINKKTVDYNGYITFDFFPGPIPFNDIGLWFTEGDVLEFEIYKPSDKSIRIEKIKLEIIDTNAMEFYNINSLPSYFVENNGLILSVITKGHLKKLKQLNLSIIQCVKILSRFLNQMDQFTVYLSDINYMKVLKSQKFIKFPVGDIIIEINDIKFNTYKEFIKIVNSMKIVKIKTLDNDIYYL